MCQTQKPARAKALYAGERGSFPIRENERWTTRDGIEWVGNPA